MKNLNQPSTTSTTGQGYYAPPTPPAKPTGAYLPTEQLVKQLKRKKLLSPIAPHHQPVDADTFHGSASEAKKPKALASQEKKKEHSSAWGWALLIGGGALVALIATLTFNKEAREKVAEVVPFLKTKTEALGENPPELNPEPLLPDPPPDNPKEPKKQPQKSNIGEPPSDNSENLLPNPPQDNTGGNVEGNSTTGIGEGSNNNDSNGNLSGTGDSLSEPLNPTNAQGTIPSNPSSEILSEDSLSELVGAGSLSSIDPIIPIITNPLLHINPIINDPLIGIAIPTAGEEAKTKLWRRIEYDLNNSPNHFWVRDIERTDFSTADLQHFQDQCLSAVKNLSKKAKEQDYCIITNHALGVIHNIIEKLSSYKNELGLSSEDNHLALAYAYYNKALILSAKGNPKDQDFARSAFQKSMKYLEPLDYVTVGSEGYLFYDTAKSYLVHYEGTNAHKTTPKLPTADEIDGLLPFPIFKSELATNALKQATKEWDLFQPESTKITKMTPWLDHAGAYYLGIVNDPEMELRWHGHAGLAETLALRAKLEKGENANVLKFNAKKHLDLAIANTKLASDNWNQRIYQVGVKMPAEQQQRIEDLLK
ncbi:MAG: hypothetical protein NTW61_10185 [Candidatus Melainabacteria bacterium]|nr:hypothetical protein [Candidatus Melainabacteria bacterium]